MNMQDFRNETILANLGKVLKAYSGKSNHCCCGCAGNHYTTEQGKRHDYDKVDERQVRRIVNVIKANINDARLEEGYIYFDTGTRIYVAYYQE